MRIRSAGGRHSGSDVAVVGAGPVGCVTAIALARKGMRVTLLEAEPDAGQRLAGEWLHPSAVELLRRFGGAPVVGSTRDGRGFVVFPEDGSAPIVLAYPGSMAGASCEHSELVSALRAAAMAEPGIRLLARTRVTGLERRSLLVRKADGGVTELPADLVVGADGRSSVVRRLSGIPNGRRVVSHMAALTLEGAELPFEGFGHVVLGGPGPILAYRVGDDRIRVCFDVPPPLPSPRRARNHLLTAYGRVLPESLRPAFSAALATGRLQWASNHFRTRRRKANYGRGRALLVGDAVGHFHPLTTVGLALGFADAESLARTGGLGSYRRERVARSSVPELLSVLLYEAFTRRDEGTVALRSAIYELWRSNPDERARTLRLLSGDETGLWAFCCSFMSVLGLAFDDSREAIRRGEVRIPARSIGGLGLWLPRLAAVGFSRPDYGAALQA